MKKRLVCLILAALLGLSLFSCNNDDVPSDSSEGSAEQSDDVSETVSDDGSAAIAAEEAAKIDAMLSGGVPDRTLNRKNELLGLPYKLSRTAGSGDDYADPDGTKLTDGNYAENFNTYTWTGFAGQNPVSVDFDLGEEKKLVSDVEIGCLRHLDYGIGLPDTVTLYASEDGEEYIKLGTLLKPDGLNSVVKYTYSFKLQESVGIRYLRIVFSGLENVWFFIDEISAYSYSEENEPPAGTVNDYYGDEPLTETEPVYWPETDPDYDKTINLSASNAEVYVYALSAFEEADAEDAAQTAEGGLFLLGGQVRFLGTDGSGGGEYAVADLNIGNVHPLQGAYLDIVPLGHAFHPGGYADGVKRIGSEAAVFPVLLQLDEQDVRACLDGLRTPVGKEVLLKIIGYIRQKQYIVNWSDDHGILLSFRFSLPFSFRLFCSRRIFC